MYIHGFLGRLISDLISKLERDSSKIGVDSYKKRQAFHFQTTNFVSNSGHVHRFNHLDKHLLSASYA